MDTLILWALPVFALSMLFELWHARRRGARAVYESRDAWASIAMGLGSVVVGIPFKLGFVYLLSVLYEHRLFTIEPTALGYVALFFAEDLCYYWSHRINHEVRLFWAAHVNHHSSTHYNLATAVRQSWTQPYLMWVFWLPLPLLGFAPHLIVLQMAIGLIYQFFIHTQEVDKLGPLEWVLNTPSHHRVHHAVNVRYLDKNHAGILILWDRLFGSFVAERADDPPVYGITKNIETFNPLRIASHEWISLLHDVRRAPRLIDKLRYVFSPPGYSHDGSTLTSKQLQERLRPAPAE
jgi:sterol desaturase/sphingolipid hydroxylase (fatty acid hydroxylase superfamily)